MPMLTSLFLVFTALSPQQENSVLEVEQALADFSAEPTCNAVVKEAQAFAKKDKKVKIPSTKAMRASALLPVVRLSIMKALEYDQSLSQAEEDSSTLKIYTDNDLQLKITLQWDLSALVFNLSEDSIIARAQAEEKMQAETKKLVIETYHQRRKLQVLLKLLGSDAAVETVVEWRLAIAELTALLDGLTGGWFSKQIETTAGAP